MFAIKEILDLAVRLEKNGEATYRRAIPSAADGELRAALAWMAEEEAHHGRWFARLKESLDTGSKNPFLEEMGKQLLQDVLGGQSFSLKEVDFAGIASRNELIRVFIEFEKDTVLFYEMIAPFVEDGETRGQLEAIIAEENRHIERLKQFIEKGEEVPAGGR